MEEIWKDVEGYENIYQVSNFGRVRSVDRYTPKLGKFNYFFKGKPVAITDNGNGYKIVSLSKMGRKNHYVHRLVAKAFITKDESTTEINHKDYDKSNNHYLNLEWVTREQNMIHKIKDNRMIGYLTKNCFSVVDLISGKRYTILADCARDNGLNVGTFRDGLLKHKGIYKGRYLKLSKEYLY